MKRILLTFSISFLIFPFTGAAQGEQRYASGTATDQENNSFEWINYGTQDWTIENAKVETYRDGTEIPQVTDASVWANLTTGAWCYYDNDPTKGKLYNWYAVAGIHDSDPNTPNKEFAPQGWHVPVDAEWRTLQNYLIENGYNYDGITSGNKIAKAMASTSGWYNSTQVGAIGNNQNLNNSSGFNALPEGQRNNFGSFESESSIAFFWNPAENSTSDAWSQMLGNDSSFLDGGINYAKQEGFSMRFVRDASSDGAFEIKLNGIVSAENNQIKNVADPTDNQDAATKSYVDNNVNSFSGSYNDLTDQPSLRDLTGDNPVIFGSLSAFGGTYNNRAILDLVANIEGNLITGYKNGSSGDRFNVKLDTTNENAVVSSGGGYNLKLYSEGGTMEFEGDAMMSTPSFTFNGAVTATSFAGDGSQLTNLPTSDVSYNDLTDKPTTYTQAQVDALISNLQIDNNFSDVKLIGVSETYIVPSGKSSRISNVLGSTHWRTPGNNDGGLDRKIIVNGATIYIGGTYKQFVNSNDSRLLWTLFTVKGEYWFPSGTTIQIGSSENINYLSIQETDVTNVKSFLITEPSTVPSGKKWKISSVLPSRALYGDADYKIEINSTSVFVGSGQNFTGSYTFGHMIINLIDGPIWLPEGTTLGPSDNIYGVSVVEYSN